MEHRKENIVMFPFMAQGHMIPFLALALKLEQTNKYTITIISTPLNLNKLRPYLPPNSSIAFLEIPYNSHDHGLPPNIQNTDSLPYDLILKFCVSTLELKPVFRKTISALVGEQGKTPLCLITDTFFAWCADIAHDFGICHALFNGGGAFGFACYYSLWLNLPHRKSDSSEFMLPDFPEADKLHVNQLTEFLRDADGTDSFSKFQNKVLSEWAKSDGILFNTIDHLDRLGLMYFKRKLGNLVWPIGPILLSSETRAQEAGSKTELCKNWLDTKPSNSVLYISFGSQNTISASQMMQLAMALEASGKFFIWVVRPPVGFDINTEFKAKEWLPERFEKRIRESNRGLLVHKWAPQLEILSHKSVSTFLSHCGWNSVLESLSHGVPLLGWPMAGEQFYNVKLLEEQIGVCVEVARGKSCEIRHETVAEKIDLVMNGTEKGNEMRRKAYEVKGMIEEAIKDREGFKGSSVEAMDDFLNNALLIREKRKKEQKHDSESHQLFVANA